MCLPCIRTQGDDYLGIGRVINCVVNMVVIGGITALVAAFAANYFESGVVGSFALNTAVILGVGALVLGVLGVSFFAIIACIFSRGFRS